jgi:hypothetical protein
MPYHIARIDVHKKMVTVVVADVEVEGEYQFCTPEGRDQPRPSPIGEPVAARRISRMPNA